MEGLGRILMALQTEGAINFTDIAAEFDGEVPHSISEYYGASVDLPESGVFSMSDFYGTSNIPELTYVTTFTGEGATAVDLGDAADDRFIVVVTACANNGSALSSIDVGGTALTIRNGTGTVGWENAGLGYAFIPSGSGNQNITVNWTGSSVISSVYVIRKAEVGFVNWWTGGSINTDIETEVGDCIIGATASPNTGYPTWTIEGVTDPQDHTQRVGTLDYTANSFQAVDTSTSIQTGGYEIAIVQVR